MSLRLRDSNNSHQKNIFQHVKFLYITERRAAISSEFIRIYHDSEGEMEFQDDERSIAHSRALGSDKLIT